MSRFNYYPELTSNPESMDTFLIFDNSALDLRQVSVNRLRNSILKPQESIVPQNNGELVLELTSDTSLTIKVKGSDGIVRSTILTLS